MQERPSVCVWGTPDQPVQAAHTEQLRWEPSVVQFQTDMDWSLASYRYALEILTPHPLAIVSSVVSTRGLTLEQRPWMTVSVRMATQGAEGSVCLAKRGRFPMKGNASFVRQGNTVWAKPTTSHVLAICSRTEGLECVLRVV